MVNEALLSPSPALSSPALSSSSPSLSSSPLCPLALVAPTPAVLVSPSLWSSPSCSLPSGALAVAWLACLELLRCWPDWSPTAAALAVLSFLLGVLRVLCSCKMDVACSPSPSCSPSATPALSSSSSSFPPRASGLQRCALSSFSPALLCSPSCPLSSGAPTATLLAFLELL